MSKQKKTPSQQSAPRTTEAAGADQAPELSEQRALGNAALLAGMSRGTEEGFGVELDPRDIAVPAVGRAVLALELLPRETATVDRFLEILAGSKLPADRRETLVERIESDQAAARGISDAMTASFGEDTRALRSELVTSLEGLWNALQGGSLEGATWTGVEGAVVELGEGMAEASAAERADALIEALSPQAVTPAVAERAGPDVGASVQRFCSAVSLALRMAREEDEEESYEPEYGEEIG